MVGETQIEAPYVAAGSTPDAAIRRAPLPPRIFKDVEKALDSKVGDRGHLVAFNATSGLELLHKGIV